MSNMLSLMLAVIVLAGIGWFLWTRRQAIQEARPSNWFFDLDRRKGSLVAGLVITFAFTLLRAAEAKDARSLLIALALGVFAFGLALFLFVESGNYHARLEAWRDAQQKGKTAILKVSNLDSTNGELVETRTEIDGIMQYLAVRRMLSFDRDATGKLAANMAVEGYLTGIAKNRARFAPGKDFGNE